MSRIGKLPIPIPQGVKIQVDGATVRAEGPKGKLAQAVPTGLTTRVADGTIFIERAGDDRQVRALHGLARALVANMVTGVKDGFTKSLELQGVGYRVAKVGEYLVFSVGYSHPVQVIPPDGISFTVEGVNKVTVSGIDKQLVGQVAANIRSIRKPEPYKGKGIRYAGEVVRMKAGKAGKAAGGKKK